MAFIFNGFGCIIDLSIYLNLFTFTTRHARCSEMREKLIFRANDR